MTDGESSTITALILMLSFKNVSQSLVLPTFHPVLILLNIKQNILTSPMKEKSHSSMAPVFSHWLRSSCLCPSLSDAVCIWVERVMKGILAPPCLFLVWSTRSIADWLKPPDTWFLLDFIKPEFLLLRVSAPICICTSACVCLCSLFPLFHYLIYMSLCLASSPLKTLARCIIMWDEILPNTEWLRSNIPQVRKYARMNSIIETYFLA